MSDVEDQIKAAFDHAATLILQGLQAAERGYTSLTADDPLVTDGVAQAQAHASANGVPDDQVAAIDAPQVVQATQNLGAAQTQPAVTPDPDDDNDDEVSEPAADDPEAPKEDQA
jgi:hypothetical protein